jgi:hypothetical protein
MAAGGFVAGIGASFLLMKYYQERAVEQLQQQMKQNKTGIGDIFEIASKSSQGMSTSDILAGPESNKDVSHSNPPADIREDVEAIYEALRSNDDEYDDDGETFADTDDDEEDTIPEISDAMHERGEDLIQKMLQQTKKDQGPPKKKKQQKKEKRKNIPIRFKRND